MYQEIYIDVVFAANLLMDYLLLRLVGWFLRCRAGRRRCFAAAALYSFGKHSCTDSGTPWILCTGDASDRA